MMNGTNDYRDANKILDQYNQSIEAYNIYLQRDPADVSNSFQSKLNDAGEKIYICFETAIKHVLEKYYKSKLKMGDITQSVYINKKSNIERKNRPDLIRDLMTCNPPKLSVQTVDYIVINENASVVVNKKKHELRDVDEAKYLAVVPEVRKFLLTYIDPNVQLKVIEQERVSILCIDKLLSLTGNFQDNECSYILLTDSLRDLPIEQQKAITYVKWSLVIDLDAHSAQGGLYDAFLKHYGRQPNLVSPKTPEKTIFDAFSSPFWFFLNGKEEFSETVTEGYSRKWNQLYGRHLNTVISNFHSVFEKKAYLLVLSSDTRLAEKVLEVFDATYEDELTILFLSEYPNDIPDQWHSEQCLMTPSNMAQGLLSYGQLFGNKAVAMDTLMPGKEGNLINVNKDSYPHLELLHQDVGIYVPDDINDARKMFYQGREQLSWYGAQNGFAVNRNAGVKKLNDFIKNSADANNFYEIKHEPGIGGSTFARLYAYSIRLDHPVCFLNTYIKDNTVTQINNLYNVLRAEIIIFIDSSVLSAEQVKLLRRELKDVSFPYIVFYIKRKTVSEKPLLQQLNDIECSQMIDRLKPYATEEKLEYLNRIPTDVSMQADRSPFFMALSVFEKNFYGIKEYISRFLKNMPEEHKKLLQYISLADKYAHKYISLSFFHNMKPKGESTIPFNSLAMESLLVYEKLEKNCFLRIRHHLFAEEIIKQLLLTDAQGNELRREDAANRILMVMIDLIQDSKSNTTVDYDSVLEVLNSLFITRDDKELNRGKFAPLVEELRKMSATNVSGDNRAGLIFKKLVETYPNNPHFLAHLSRFYTYVEKDYQKGINIAREALDLSFLNDEKGNESLYHINGMAYMTRALKYWCKELKEAYCNKDEERMAQFIQELVSDTDTALTYFEQSVSSKNQDAGYQAAIDLCVRVLDTAKLISGFPKLDEMLASNPSAWYIKYIDTAAELLQQWETDDEYIKDKAKTKINLLYGDLESLDRIIAKWQEALENATMSNLNLRRHLLVMLKNRKANMVGYEYLSINEIDDIIALSEKNIDEQPENGANIKIWFNAVRYCTSQPSVLLDSVLDKLSVWKQSGSIEAYYYYFICMCIKAIDGSIRAESAIPQLQHELKEKAKNHSNSRTIYEWLGQGEGLGRLQRIPVSELIKTQQEIETNPQSDKEWPLSTLNGSIVKYKNPSNGLIRSHNMNVFFVPDQSSTIVMESNEGQSVEFSLGFSYEGPRAYNHSVKLIGENVIIKEHSTPNVPHIGQQRVRCQVIKNLEYFTQVKLLDYSNSFGSIHVDELGEEYSADNRPSKEAILYAKIIGEKKFIYWQMSLWNTRDD